MPALLIRSLAGAGLPPPEFACFASPLPSRAGFSTQNSEDPRKILSFWKSWYARNKGNIRIEEMERSHDPEVADRRRERLYQIDIARIQWYKGEVSLDENGRIPYKMPTTQKPKPDEEAANSGADGPRYNSTGLGWLVAALCLSAAAVLVVRRLIRKRKGR
ncbi:MAG: hypothetical protein R3F11_00570 [Verrucomicrobiales bacterium]